MRVGYNCQVMAPTAHCRVFPIHHFWILQEQLKNYSHLKSTWPVLSKSIAIRPDNGCESGGCVRKWVWLSTKCFPFTLFYATSLPDSTFLKHAKYNWPTQNIHCNLSYTCTNFQLYSTCTSSKLWRLEVCQAYSKQVKCG